MDDQTVVIVLRMAERLIAVGIAGAAIYLGFRLFVLVPTQNDSSGKIELPGFGVVLSKAGPGLFFAAFGAGILIWSLNSPVGFGGNDGFVGGVAGLDRDRVVGRVADQDDGVDPAPAEAPRATPQEQARMTQALQVMNCAESVMTGPRVNMKAEDIEEAFALARESMLVSVWHDDWGTVDAFRQWSSTRSVEIDERVLGMYEGELLGCPS